MLNYTPTSCRTILKDQIINFGSTFMFLNAIKFVDEFLSLHYLCITLLLGYTLCSA